MFEAHDLTDELHALKQYASGLMNGARAEHVEASSIRADALADQIKSILSELGEAANKQQEHAEQLISGHPITTLASAFALGVVVGSMLGRH